jgi:hypothetical protein
LFSGEVLYTRRDGQTAEADAIKTFWEVIGSFDDERRSQFVQFVTGNKFSPLRGFQGMGRQFRIFKSEESSRMPVAQTCRMLLILPDISDGDMMSERLNWAIDSGLEGFLLG